MKNKNKELMDMEDDIYSRHPKPHNLPLWKVLNEQRTKGEWNSIATSPEGNNFDILLYGQSGKRNGTGTLSIGRFEENEMWYYKKDEVKANAAYTALAVNNLHILAEALDGLMKKAEVFHSIYFNNELRAAKEALNNIS